MTHARLPHPVDGQRTLRQFIAAALLSMSACAGSSSLTLEQLEGGVYRHADLVDTLAAIGTRHGAITEVNVIGKTHEGRDIHVVRISGDAARGAERPELLAIFAQHGAEHSMTNLAVDLIRELASRYGVDARTTNMLDSATLWIVPMANPDGVDFDLSGEGEPFSWRKNRVPAGPDAIGVDLNRNWSRTSARGEVPPSDHLDPSSDHFWGPSAFSELEIRAIRDFIEGRPNLRFFLDYHTGSGGFVQGVVGCWMPRERMPPTVVAACTRVIDGFAAAISDSGVALPPFQVTAEPEGMVDVLHEHAPFFLKPFLPDSLPRAVGFATDYVSGEKHIPGIGLEIDRDRPRYVQGLPDSQRDITDRHIRGLLYLAESIVRDN